MYFQSDATIKGDGELTLKSLKTFGIYMEDTLVIDGCKLLVEGKWGISGYDATHGEVLTIRNASVTAKGYEGSICNLADFKLQGKCEITSPASAVWNAEKHAVCDASGNIITDEVVITPVEEYNFEIAGVEVTSTNYEKLDEIPGVTGTVSYDPDTKTLTLDDATIDGGENFGIYSDTELTCVVKGNVTIASSECHAMNFEEKATIKGDGHLVAKSPEVAAIRIVDSLLIDSCTVSAEGSWGIATARDLRALHLKGSTGHSEVAQSGDPAEESEFQVVLIIKNSSVTAKGTEGSITGLTSFELEGCEITKPAGAVWNDEKYALCDAAGNVIKDEVVITPTGGTAIDFVTPEQRPAEGAIYDMNGVLRSEPLEELPTGVYIVGGRKVMHVQR